MRGSRLILLLLLILLPLASVQALDPCIEKYGVVKGLLVWQEIIRDYQNTLRELVPGITDEQIRQMTLQSFEGQFSTLMNTLVQEMEEDLARKAVKALQTPALLPVP